MEPKLVNELKNKHKGADVYVVGSGPSLDYVDKSFFHNKVTICINHTIEIIDYAPSMYLVAKEPDRAMQDAAHKRKALIVMCKHHSGVPRNPLNNIFYPQSTYLFEAKASVIKKKGQGKALERSSSTIVTGLHLAAMMGAKNIILVAHDCGTLNKNMHVANYNKQHAVMQGRGYAKWMKNNKVEAKTLAAKKLIEQFYNARIYSLNPFINFGLEGNEYRRF